MATMGTRSAGVTVRHSNAYIQPTPLLPQKTRAPTVEACFTISNCECSPSATMYSQSSLAVGDQLGDVLNHRVVWTDRVAGDHVHVGQLASHGDGFAAR